MSATVSPLETLITRAWQRRGLIACALWPLSLVYGGLLSLRRGMYRLGVLKQTRLPVPLIIVGNIFVGGTGKTPLVIWLVQQLRQRGYTPGVISRGYGGSHADIAEVAEVDQSSSPQEAGDEPVLIAQKTQVPLMVGRKRVEAARALLKAHPEVNLIISDDGLQHYALGRQIEIQLSDERGHGNGWLLPAGPLRESAARRSDFYVVNSGSSDLAHGFAMQLQGGYAEQLSDRRHRLALDALPQAARVAAVAGIGNPQRFFTMLRAAGVLLSDTLALPDHDDFSRHPFAQIQADIILITEKDAVKCASIKALARDTRLWVVPVEANIAGPLADHILEKLRGYPTA